MVSPDAASAPRDVASTPPVVMTIAGTDSGGGAGLAADLKAFAAQRTHGVFAVTAVTAQSTVEVRTVHAVPDDVLAAQIDTVLDDLPVEATKTGLLWGVEAVDAVADRAMRLGALVVDPVLVNASAVPMQPPVVEERYRKRLFPAATVITPNEAEAALLSGRDRNGLSGARAAAATLVDSGVRHVVVTGVLVDDMAIDVWASADGIVELEAARVDTPNVHGTGCSFAATIAARLAHGDTPHEAIVCAKTIIAAAIASAADWRLGSGQGPIDHFAEVRR